MRYYRCGGCGAEIEAAHCLDNCIFCGTMDLSRDVIGYIHQDILEEELNDPEDEWQECPTE